MLPRDKSLNLGQDLPLLQHCPLCAVAYTKTGRTVVEATDNAEVVHLECISCHSALLAVITQSQLGMGSIATMTDLSANDAKRLRGQPELSSDDVLAFHEFLEQHNKTFANLFR